MLCITRGGAALAVVATYPSYGLSAQTKALPCHADCSSTASLSTRTTPSAATRSPLAVARKSLGKGQELIPTGSRTTLALLIISVLLSSGLTACAAPDKTIASQAGSQPSWSIGSTPSEPTPTAAPPTPTDFVVGVVVTEQRCYGSAGCTYHYTINPQYISAKPLPDKTTVVFRVTGGEQDQIGNFTIDGDGTASFDRETMISGPEGADLRAVVTQVIPGR